MYFESFYKLYPNAPYYGTPRHLRKFPSIPWKGDLNQETVRKTWEPEVEMRIPDGAEFVVNKKKNTYKEIGSVRVRRDEGRVSVETNHIIS